MPHEGLAASEMQTRCKLEQHQQALGKRSSHRAVGGNYPSLWKGWKGASRTWSSSRRGGKLFRNDTVRGCNQRWQSQAASWKSNVSYPTNSWRDCGAARSCWIPQCAGSSPHWNAQCVETYHFHSDTDGYALRSDLRGPLISTSEKANPSSE